MDPDLFENEPLPDDVLDHVDDPEVRDRWPRKLVEVYDVVVAVLRRDVDDAQAAQMATRVIDALAHHHGGRQWYMPTGEKLRLALRDKQIWDRFDGSPETIARLCREYRLTQQMIYKILREQRALHRKRVQPELPLRQRAG